MKVGDTVKIEAWGFSTSFYIVRISSIDDNAIVGNYKTFHDSGRSGPIGIQGRFPLVDINSINPSKCKVKGL